MQRKCRAADNPLRIAVTLGDPAGVGPEVVLRALANMPSGSDFFPVIIGRAGIIKHHYPSYFPMLVPFSGEERSPGAGRIFIDDISFDAPVPEPGIGSIDTARESLVYIDRSVELWKQGLVDAVVTGPVNKGLIEKSGVPFMGHTEYYADKIGGNPYMMMFSSEYRVLLVTTHIAVNELWSFVTEDSIYRTIMTGSSALSRIDGRKPSIAVCGYDPHCGDHGAIGTFDDVVTAKAVDKARREGVDVCGPLSADTLFMPSKWRNYSLVIAQYHDQGLIPFKIMAFESGVNVTLGLDLVRTSVDHGTAFDIAGKGTASHESMSEAVRLAVRLVSLNV